MKTAMDIGEALHQLGVRDGLLTRGEIEKLDRDGFLHLKRVLMTDHVGRINARLNELLQEEGANAGKEVHQEAGADRLANLVNKGEIFRPMFMHPRVLSAVAHVLEGDVKLSTLNSRAALPGQGQQALHIDGFFERVPVPDKFDVCNTIWLLDDFTPENGATRIVPGSHLWCQHPAKGMADAMVPHPQEIQLLGSAGDVVIFNSQCWHGGTLNRSNKLRRSITAYYARRHMKQMTDQRKHLRPEVRAELSEAALLLLDAL